MSSPSRRIHISAEEYLKREKETDIRHEYVDGQVFAMSGATEAHNLICANIQMFLHSHVSKTGCRVFQNGMKLRIEHLNRFYYPDIMLTCEQFEPKSLFKEAPILIAEVLSPSTQQIDHREKFIAYKQIPSLKEYLLIHQERRRVEMYNKDQKGEWFLTVASGAESIELQSLPTGAVELPLEVFYEGYELPYTVRESEEEYTLEAQPT